MNEPRITIFTPTYNRAWILRSAYESLLKQNYSNFKWVIMDDGSADNTKELIYTWIEENEIEIEYYYQLNQGRFAAFNNAKNFFEGDLLLILDSDDFLLENSLTKIIMTWNNIDKNQYSGIISYFEGADGNIIGTEFPKTLIAERLYVLYDKYKMTGDKFLVFKKSLVDQVSYKTYENEKFGGDSTLFNKINEIAPMYIYSEKLCHREYQEDSITNNLLKNHMISPNGIRDHYLDCLRHEKNQRKKILKHSIGFITFSKLSGKKFKFMFSQTPYRFTLILLYFPALFYKHYLQNKAKDLI